jgi:STE24 endopeptidase
MNLYAIVILITLLVGYFLNLAADILNLRALKHETPAELEGLYDQEAYRSSQRYTLAQTRFGWLSSTCMLAAMLVFWFAGGFQVLDVFVRSWSLGPVGSGLVYIGILVSAQALLSLPFQLYSTFGIETRFGFNQTSLATFCADRLKGFGLAIVLGVPLLAGVLAFFTYAGPYAWLYCWVAITFFSLALQLIAPTWIMPLFNTFTPLAPGELREAILTYARAVQFPVDDVYVMDGSKRSNKSNAFFTGFGRHKRIALFDTLVSAHTVPELLSVVAHEVGHYKMRHIVKNMLLGITHAGVMLYLLSMFLHHAGLFEAFEVTTPSVYAGLVFFGMLYAPVELLLSIGMQIVSRQHEYDADRYAVETAGNPTAMGDALKKLALHNLTHLTPHPFYVFLHYSHPPIWQRLQAIDRLAAQSEA